MDGWAEVLVVVRCPEKPPPSSTGRNERGWFPTRFSDSLQTSTRHEATDYLGKYAQMTTGPYRQHALEVVRRKGVNQRRLEERGREAISHLAAIPYRLHEESQSRSQPQAHTDSTILPPQVNVVTLSSSNSSSTSSTRCALNALSQSSVQFGASL